MSRGEGSGASTAFGARREPYTMRILLQDQMAELPEPERKNPYNRANSLEELLSWEDVNFVCCAYVTILGRQPDSSGQAHHVQQIRAGYSKLDVLRRLRRSAEAKDHDPGIAGLDRALKRAARERRPLLGAYARLTRADADGDSRHDRALRTLMNATAVNQSFLEMISERLIADEASSAPRTGLSAGSTPSSGQLNPVSDIVTDDRFKRVMGNKTPELDHLRTKSKPSRLMVPSDED